RCRATPCRPPLRGPRGCPTTCRRACAPPCRSARLTRKCHGGRIAIIARQHGAVRCGYASRRALAGFVSPEKGAYSFSQVWSSSVETRGGGRNAAHKLSFCPLGRGVV